MRSEPYLPIAIALACAAAFFGLAIGNITSTSPTFDEPAHLAAGWSMLTSGDHRLNPEHPPLLKLIAALPLGELWPLREERPDPAARERLLRAWDAAALGRPLAEWRFAHALFYATHPEESHALFRRARMTLLFVTGLGLLAIVFAWSSELWGAWGAALSTALLAFEPNLIAHAGLVTTDVGAAFLMCGCVYFFWRCCRYASYANAIAFALFFALAQIAKFSAVLLVPMLIAVAALMLRKREAVLRMAIVLAATAVLTVLTIWTAYGLRFAASDMGSLPMRELVTDWYAKRGDAKIGAAGRTLLALHERQLLPEAYLYGLAQVQSGTYGRATYFKGVLSNEGRRDYFFWTMLWKTPVALLAAIVAAMVLVTRRAPIAALCLLAPVAIYFGVAVVTKLNIGHRHILPILPFLFVLCGGLPRRWLIAAGFAALSCFVVFTPFVPVYGRHLSYFNEIAGGPVNAHEKLIDSNLDWGQDLPRLAKLVGGQPIQLIYFGSADPAAYGIRYVNLEGGYYAVPSVPRTAARASGLFAISATDYATNRYWRGFLDHHRARPAGRAGHSILLFRL